MPSLSIVTSSKWVSSVTDGSFGPVSQMDLGLQHLHIQIIRHFILNLLFKSNNVLFCGTLVRAGTHGFLLLKHGSHTWHLKRHASLCPSCYNLASRCSRHPAKQSPLQRCGDISFLDISSVKSLPAHSVFKMGRILFTRTVYHISFRSPPSSPPSTFCLSSVRNAW